jgi:hypothetical protein
VITPVIDGDAELAAKLDAIPGEIQRAIRAALVRRTAGIPPARFRPRSARAFVLRTAGVPPALRAAIETALQQVLHQ